jgi:hypothetical protein
MALEQGEHGVRPYKSSGGSGETRTPKGFNPSRFQDDVLSRFASLPLEIPLGFEPNIFSFAAKTHAIWLEIIWCSCQNLGFQVLTFDSVTLETFGGKARGYW